MGGHRQQQAQCGEHARQRTAFHDELPVAGTALIREEFTVVVWGALVQAEQPLASQACTAS